MGDELIRALQKDAGLSREQATSAARVVQRFIEERATEKGSRPDPEEFRGLFTGSIGMFEGREGS